MAAVRDGTSGKTGPRTLDGHGASRDGRLAQDGTNLVLTHGKGNALRLSRAARLIANVFLVFRGKGSDLHHANLFRAASL